MTFNRRLIIIVIIAITITITVIIIIVIVRNWVFMMFAVSNFLTSLGYPIPYTFVPVNILQKKKKKSSTNTNSLRFFGF